MIEVRGRSLFVEEEEIRPGPFLKIEEDLRRQGEMITDYEYAFLNINRALAIEELLENFHLNDIKWKDFAEYTYNKLKDKTKVDKLNNLDEKTIFILKKICLKGEFTSKDITYLVNEYGIHLKETYEDMNIVYFYKNGDTILFYCDN